MNPKLVLFSLVALICASAQAQYANPPLLHLSFDHVSGSTVTNDGSGGSALNGTLIGTASIAAGGKFGNCLHITGANAAAAFCAVSNAVVPLNIGAGNNWTVAMWIKTPTAGGAYGYQGDGVWSSGNTTFYLNNGGFATSGTQAGGVRWGQGNEAGATSGLNDGNWHHVALECNGTAKTLYVDGSVNSLTTDQWNGNGTGGQFWIGGSGDPQDGGNNLNGYVDEVYVFNGTLSASQIQSLYLSNSVAGGLTNTNFVYQPNWASVDQHNPAPEWFQDAKFGIYFHWGVFSVPAYGTEWYPRNMYNMGDPTYSHHTNTFGNPFGNNPPPYFPYDYFITAGHTNLAGTGNWQFAPVLKSQGGNWDPDAWAQLFLNAGAKFAGPVAEHHDGYSMWNSAANEWNSVKYGPHQDLASIWATAIRAKGLKFLMAMHHAFNFLGYYQFAPGQTNASLQKLYGQLGSGAENQLWYDKLKEIIDGYQPDIIWQDFDLYNVNESQRLNFLSYYYNSALGWNKEVVATYKDGFNTNGEVFDIERGGPGDLLSPYWLTDDSISSNSWCYVNGMGYYGTNAMICALIDRVSKNGNMLLNISPTADGTIPQAQQNILLGIGDWLGRFGECIYSNRAWVVYGEGPTAMGGGSFVAPVAGTSTDIRFMRNKATNALYAIVMGWPGSQLNITTLNADSFNLATLTNVQLLGATAGTYINLQTPVQDATGLKITLPSQPYNATAYAIKLSFSGTIPSYTPALAPAAPDIDIGPTGTSVGVNNGNNNWRHVAGSATDSETFDTSTRPSSGDTNGSVYVQFGFNPSYGANNFVSLEDNYGDIYGNGMGPNGMFNSQLYATIELDIKYDSSSTMPISYSTGSTGTGALQIGLSTLWNPVVQETNVDLSTLNDGSWHHLSVPIDPRNMPTNCWGVYFYIWHGNPPYDPAGTVKFWVANIVVKALVVPLVIGPVLWTNPAQPLTARVNDLISRMTLPEKIGLLQGDANYGSVPVPRLGIPGYGWWSEALHGIGWGYPSTVFPQAIGMAATWDAPLIQSEADVISTEARAYNNDYRYANNGESRNGIGLTYWSPNINICRDPRWGRNQETYGEDPFLEGGITVAYVNGMQGTNPTYLKTSACVKHFVCYDGPEPGRLTQDTEPPQRDLYETYLPPFETAVRQGHVSGVMTAYPSLYSVPQCASTNLISGMLRNDWGFDGYVVCDCDAIGNLWSAFNYVATPEAAAAMGINAGNDVDCGGTFNYLPQALQEGLTTVDSLNQAASNALRIRFRLGLFDPTNLVPWSGFGVAQNNNTPAQHALALTVAEESMVLLKNNGILPLDRTKIRRLAVIGANANDTNMLVGNYNGTPFNPVTILAGIQQVAGPNIQVTYTLGCPLALANSGTNAPTPQMTQTALTAATNADAVIYVGGLNAQLESEDNWNVPFVGFNQGDRSQIELPSPQDSLLRALQATGKPVIFVNCSGDAIAMPWEATNLAAILQAWYPGEQGGTAVAEVLFGVVNPAGRLPVTFYTATADLPALTNYSMANRTYRYFNGTPLWAFGHGLSYSSFNYKSAQLDKSRATAADQINVTITLQNTSTNAGDEVPQVYFQHLNSAVSQPIKALCAFTRVHLAAGQTTQVTLPISVQQFRYWNTNLQQYVVEPGNYQLQIGAASDDIRLSLPLQVTLPPVSLSTAGNVVALTWGATSNSVYQMQYTTNLAAPFWQNLGSPITATNGSISTTDSPANLGQKFYRVRLVQ